MRSQILIVAALAISSCAPSVQPQAANLAVELAGRTAGPPQDCISTRVDQNMRPLDSRTIAYGMGRTVYINHLPGECYGLSPFNTVVAYPLSGSQYCRGDRIRAVQPGENIPGAYCNLGSWVPYTLP
ncbi:MAG TPA: hypothetical protein VIM74_03645 [Casimicrobiaceae bacterium]